MDMQSLLREKGDFILPEGAKINGVLHIPNFKHNLLSGSRICKDLQCAVTFFPNFFVMQGLRTRSLIGSGKCQGGLYLMGMFEKGRRVMMTTTDTWYKRLGHASRDKLSNVSFLKNNSSKLSNVFCDSCAKAKHVRNPFPKGFIKTNGCFELIHGDIWGGYRIPSYTRANFFLTIVDDYSSCFEQATHDEKWWNAMQQELKALKKNGTWTLEELPEGKRPIDSKWVYKTKFKSNGEVERYKARLVAKGFTQRE
nr:integrase, catalytic core [Tanacetum cinerariifolium]